MSNNDFEIADVLSSKVDQGEVRLTVGDVITGTTYATDCQFWGTDGFYGIPAAGNASDGTAQALFFVDGNAKRVVGSRDNRTVEKYGSLEPGDRAIISTGDARFILKNNRDSVTLYSENQKDGGTSMLVDVSGKDGTISLTAGRGGMVIGPDGITIKFGNSVLVLDDKGVTLQGPSAKVVGGTVLLGAPGTIPLPGVNSVIYGPTGLTGAPSTSVFIAR